MSYFGVAPAFDATKAPVAHAKAKASAGSFLFKREAINPARNASPAPTVSTAFTLNPKLRAKNW